MSITDIKPPKEWLFESITKQAYGHTRFSEDVEMPDPEQYKEIESPDQTLNEARTLNQQQGGPKAHPIANHVYFSGVADAMQLPHESLDAIKQYLEHQLQLRMQLQMKFNPKPKIE